MPKTKKLENKISKKVEKLHQLLNKVDEARAINSDDPNTWDSDALHGLIDNCKKVIEFLEDEKHPKEKDTFGDPIILEEGLCSLVDEYHSDEEESEDH